MPTVFVTRARADFTTSGGVVAFDRLQVQILLDEAIVTQYFGACVSNVDVTGKIDLMFAGELSGAEVTALDAIISAHSGLGLPTGPSWATSHIVSNLALGGTIVVSFVDTTVVAIASIGLAHERLAIGPGRLLSVTVETDSNTTVTVQRVGNGAAVGSGVSESLTAGTPTTFELPLSEQEYAYGDTVGVALAGLDMSSDTRIEALWEDAA